MVDIETIERLSKHIVQDPGGCDIWQGAPSGGGYGHTNVRGKQTSAHRAWYEAHYGPQADLDIDHTCRDRLCCRLDHLEAVSRAENIARRDRAGTTARGERVGGAKLTADDVTTIRWLYRFGDDDGRPFTQKALARQYGVSQALISEIVRGKVWAHLPMPTMYAIVEEVAA